MTTWQRLCFFGSLVFLFNPSARADLIGLEIQSGVSGEVASFIGGIPVANFVMLGPIPSSISSISVELTVDDGDSGIGNADYDQLILHLNNINTGIKLNGFNDGSVLSLSFSGLVDEGTVGSDILSSIGLDRQVSATIVDMDGDNVDTIPGLGLFQNYASLPSMNFGVPVYASLTLSGFSAVPEPSVFYLLTLALVLAVCVQAIKPVYRRIKRMVASLFVGFAVMNAGVLNAAIVSDAIQSGLVGIVPQAGSGNYLEVASFSVSGLNPFQRLDSIGLSLTLSDGDTAIGNADLGSLELVLDGIGTGIMLNGFGNGSVQMLSFSQSLSESLGWSLFNALNDGVMVAGIVDHSNNIVDFGWMQNPIAGNYVSAPMTNQVTMQSSPSLVLASLTLTQVGAQLSAIPEPTAITIFIGLAVMIASRKQLIRSCRHKVASK